MAEQAVNSNPAGVVASRANAVANALVTPGASRFLREILEKALANPVGVAPRWSAEAWALLANILVNDYLHNWNHAGKNELNRAEEAVRNALAIDPRLALAHHANGLVCRARGEHQAALEAFREAVRLDPNFARAHAQIGNQLVLLGRLKEAPPLVEQAIALSPHDPAIGSFYWIIGRAYFFDENYREAIAWLRKSIVAQPNVWYNRLYLISALALVGGIAAAPETAPETVEAKTRLKDFQEHPLLGQHTIKRVVSYEEAHPNEDAKVVAGRKKFLDGLRKAEMAP